MILMMMIMIIMIKNNNNSNNDYVNIDNKILILTLIISW